MKKCKGCGTFLQVQNPNLEGFTQNLNSDFCERCFRIKNYNEYKVINKENEEFINILKDINDTNDLVVLLIDSFNIPNNLNEIIKYLNNDILLVYTKKDILPYKINDEKLTNYLNIKCVDKLVVSSLKNYNFDLLYNLINKYKKSKNVYIVGYTNSGKSSLINKFVKNYSTNVSEITVSNLPSTTLEKIEIDVTDDLVLIDTPGILDNGNIINNISNSLIKKVIPKKEIKPITYQIKNKQYIIIEDIFKLEANNNNLTFYISNDLNIERFYKDKELNLYMHKVDVKNNEEIVIPGLGFIAVSKDESIKIFLPLNTIVYTRRKLI